MHKSFTLAEVLIAVVIVSLVGLAILELNSNQFFIFEQTKDKKEANLLISIGVFNPIKEGNLSLFTLGKLEKNLDLSEYLKDYQIDNDEILKFYKEIKPNYFEEPFSEIDMAEEIKKDEQRYKKAIEHNVENNFIVLIDRLTMQFQKGSSALYRISLGE